MSEHRNELVSALMDGEADQGTAACVATLAREPALRRVWGRYHLISECMRHGLPHSHDRHMPARIAAALKDEPTILAPSRALREKVLRPVAGFAIAASVAVVAILGLQQNRNADPIAATPQLAVNTESPVQSSHLFTLASGRSSTGTAGPRLTSAKDNRRLNSYLVNHTEYRSQGAVQGMLPYVRIVAHENNE